MEATVEYFTESQATDEALRLFIRKMRRLHPAAFRDVWAKLPEPARDALGWSENRADRLFMDATERTWPEPEDLDDDEE